MGVRIALLRGVNVSGANRLPMAAVRDMAAGIGFGQVATHIQSGNAIFDSALATGALEATIRAGVAARFGLAPECLVLTATEVAAPMTDHPFAGADPARVHVV